MIAPAETHPLVSASQPENTVMLKMVFVNVPQTQTHVSILKFVTMFILQRSPSAFVVSLNHVQGNYLEVIAILWPVNANVQKMWKLVPKDKFVLMEHVVSYFIISFRINIKLKFCLKLVYNEFKFSFIFPYTEESTEPLPTESTSCIDTWGSDCSQFVEKCTDPDYEWYQKACKLTCGIC